MNELTPNHASTKSPHPLDSLPVYSIDMPVIFEDDGQDMGESVPHTTATSILFYGVMAHLEDNPAYELFTNLDLHYHPINPRAYVSADVMVVEPFQPLPADFDFYRIGEHGPAPLLVVEVLSARSDQQYDLTLKPKVYSQIEVAEYMIVDPTGEFLPQRLLIRRRQPNGSWLDSQDADGGVTSALGFRVVIEPDNQVRVVDLQTGHRYVRPHELGRLAKAKQMADERIREAEERSRKAEKEFRHAEERSRKAQEDIRYAEQRYRNAEEEIRKAEERSRKAKEDIRDAKEAACLAMERTEPFETDIAQIKNVALPPEHRG